MTTSPLRIVIVDDSKVGRLLLRQAVDAAGGFTVVGEAEHGKAALLVVEQTLPDLVLMDAVMPVMNGADATRAIMERWPRPVLIVSEDGGARELEFRMLAAGAVGVVRKPSRAEVADPGGLAALVERMRWAVSIPMRGGTQVSSLDGALRNALPSRAPLRFVCIAASTGGPVAIQYILRNVQLHCPVVVVQHISNGFVGHFANWLSETTRYPVRVVQEREVPRPGWVYLAPEDRHLRFRGEMLVTDDEPAVDGHRPSATALFASLAAEGLASVSAGVLLTGMGRDGAAGLLEARRAGCWTMVQSEESCVVFGMPQRAIELGAADEVAALDAIATRLAKLTTEVRDQ